MGIFREWILALAGGAVFCSVMLEVCPKGQVKTVVKTLCGILMAAALLSPLTKIDMNSYSLNLTKYALEGERIAEGGKELTETQSRTIIEERCRAYILDKGLSLGVALQDASVELKWSDEGFWYPVSCRLEGNFDSRLEAAIEAGLGISPSAQEWSGDENS